MATSIEQSVNWRNVTKKQDYQVAARQVDTFVQPQQNTRGAQVAKALGQVAGDLGQVATRKANEAKAAQAQAGAELRLRATPRGHTSPRPCETGGGRPCDDRQEFQ